MRIGIDMGHTLRGADYGVDGIRPESVLTREVGLGVISKLTALGHTVVNCTVDSAPSVTDSLYQRTYKANRSNLDIFVSIHFNATPGGYGTEIYTYGGRQLTEATRIRNEFKALGYRDRGTKDGSRLAVIRNTSSKAMLVECCFCDSSSDMAKYNADKFSNAIVKGLTGNLPNKPKEEIKVERPRYDTSIPEGDNIFKISNTTGYIEQAADGRIIVHKDRGNYIAIGQGFIDIYWNDNNGNGGRKRISE